MPSRETILFAVDFSEMTDVVIDEAIAWANRLSAPQIHAICVIDPSHNLLRREVDYAPELRELEQTLRARISEPFARAGHPLDEPGSWEISVHAHVGNPARQIADLAHEVNAEVIIIGRHGHGGAGLPTRPPGARWVGSVPARILELAHCDVLVVQPADHAAP